MTQRDKLKSRFCSSPPPKNFTWRELCSLLGGLGYSVGDGKGSHSCFYNSTTLHYIRGIPKPHGGDDAVKPIYLKIIKNALESEGAI